MMIYSHYGKKIVLASLGILRVGKRKLGGFLNEENKENGTSINLPVVLLFIFLVSSNCQYSCTNRLNGIAFRF